MGRIITKNRDPKVNEFGPDDMVLNTVTGDLFMKANNRLYQITSRNQKEDKSNEPVLNDFTISNIKTLKEGKAITNTPKSLDFSANNWISPEAIISPTDDTTYQKYTIPGRIGQYVSGTLFFDQNLSGSNNYIKMGDGNTDLDFSGSINLATLDGGSF